MKKREKNLIFSLISDRKNSGIETPVPTSTSATTMVRAHSLQFCKSNTATVTGNENEIRILGHLPDEVSHTVQSHPQLPGGQLGELSALLDTGHAQ